MASSSLVLLGVTGSIAAYKAIVLARQLRRSLLDVQVVMTAGGQRFVAPLSFEAVTGRPVLTDLFAPSASGIAHIALAHEAELLVVAPASANFLARLALGMADDPLLAIALATRSPVMVAPAMESGMWENAATQANVAVLRSRGIEILGPGVGELASGGEGTGRMLEPDEVAEAVRKRLAFESERSVTRGGSEQDGAGDGGLEGLASDHERVGARPRAEQVGEAVRKRPRLGDLEDAHVLVTAGPTWEPIDPVRILTNRSTGAMGIAIAEEAAVRGGRVTLVLGPTHLVPRNHSRLTVVRVEGAEEMLHESLKATRHVEVDILIATAAVSDFRPKHPAAQKLKRRDQAASHLELIENPDVLATLARELEGRPGPPVVVGFAAETGDLEARARAKLTAKHCDLVVGNLVGPTRGFGPRETEIVIVSAAAPPLRFGPSPKERLAEFVLDQVVSLRKERSSR